MTRRWTDYPITGTTRRKKIHITELQEAYDERIRVIRNDSARTLPDIYYPLPTWKYHFSDGKAWGASYPKADPAHWPPNETPDNNFRAAHIATPRFNFFGGTENEHEKSPSTVIKLTDTDTDYLSTYDCPPYGLDPDNYYRPWGYKVNSLFQKAIGLTDWTDTNVDSNDLIKAVHVNELRSMIEYIRTMFVMTAQIEKREREGSSSGESSGNDAWDAAMTDWENSSWGSWQVSAPGKLRCFGRITKSGSNYGALVQTSESRITVDLDLDISGMGWSVFPPVAAKIISYGKTQSKAITDIWLKCSTTGESYTLPVHSDYKRYVIDGDITSYTGSGHGSEVFTFTALNDFSSAERGAHKPDVPTEDGNNDEWSQVEVKKYGDVGPGVYEWLTNPMVVVEPNWHYGTA